MLFKKLKIKKNILTIFAYYLFVVLTEYIPINVQRIERRMHHRSNIKFWFEIGGEKKED